MYFLRKKILICCNICNILLATDPNSIVYYNDGEPNDSLQGECNITTYK